MRIQTKTIWIITIFLILMPLVCGVTFYKNEVSTLWASCKNHTYAESMAKITIRYPNGTVWIANESMAVFSEGQFNYTFISPNVTGNYIAQIECNISGVFGYDEEDFWIKKSTKEEMGVWELAVIFTVLVVMGIFAYFAKGDKETMIARSMQTIFLGVIFFMIPLLVYIARLMASSNQASQSIINLLNTVYIIGIYMAVIVVFVLFINLFINIATAWKEKKRRESEDEPT